MAHPSHRYPTPRQEWMLPTDRAPLLDSDERSDDLGDDAAGALAAAAQVKTEAQARAEAAPREASMAEAMAEPKRTSPGNVRGDAKEPAVKGITTGRANLPASSTGTSSSPRLGPAPST